ncbi:MAG TPA: 50S ribosomal protein L5 [Candidatus Hydrogenedentes bacterium]|nr:50S ribosomal protein L5 [Candidatus Hydrogenedentota bacterium]
MTPRLKERYLTEIAPRLREQFKFKNVMEAPKLEKIVVNMGVGDATQDQRMLENALAELSIIAGQKGCIRKARRSISNFKLRAGAQIGCMVTLRGDRMYEFMDRLFNIAIPRVRDFRGISPRGFDKFGNFTLGLREQTIFPEINIDKVTKVRGMNVTFVIKNSRSSDESRELLRQLGMPFSN